MSVYSQLKSAMRNVVIETMFPRGSVYRSLFNVFFADNFEQSIFYHRIVPNQVKIVKAAETDVGYSPRQEFV